MKMIVAIHQPNFLPWLGYFYKFLTCDVFVLLDSVQFTKNSFINRNKIKTNQGELWLTVPVRIEGRFGQTIDQVEIANVTNWRKKQLASLEGSYKKAPFFSDLFDQLKSIYYQQDWGSLCEFNITLLRWVMSILEIRGELMRASHLGVSGKGTELLVRIIKRLNGTVYLSGMGGKNYQDEEMFRRNNINLEYYTFQHPVYTQLHGPFLANLSIVDLLFLHGTNSRKIILTAGAQHSRDEEALIS